MFDPNRCNSELGNDLEMEIGIEDEELERTHCYGLFLKTSLRVMMWLCGESGNCEMKSLLVVSSNHCGTSVWWTWRTVRRPSGDEDPQFWRIVVKMLACCEDEDVRYVAAAGGRWRDPRGTWRSIFPGCLRWSKILFFGRRTKLVSVIVDCIFVRIGCWY